MVLGTKCQIWVLRGRFEVDFGGQGGAQDDSFTMVWEPLRMIKLRNVQKRAPQEACVVDL